MFASEVTLVGGGGPSWPISLVVEVWTRTRGPIFTLLLDLKGQVEEKPTWLRPCSRTEPEVDLLLSRVFCDKRVGLLY